jgi:hypothetical protein
MKFIIAQQEKLLKSHIPGVRRYSSASKTRQPLGAAGVVRHGVATILELYYLKKLRPSNVIISIAFVTL